MTASLVWGNAIPEAALEDITRTFSVAPDLSSLAVALHKGTHGSYDEADRGLQESGYPRNMTSREHFAVRHYTGKERTILELQDRMTQDKRRDGGEWLYASLAATSGAVSLAAGFPGRDGGVVPVYFSVPVPGLMSGWNPGSQLPQELFSMLWGLPQRYADAVHLFVKTDGLWHPLSVGYGGSCDDLCLLATDTRAAPRGARLKTE